MMRVVQIEGELWGAQIGDCDTGADGVVDWDDGIVWLSASVSRILRRSAFRQAVDLIRQKHARRLSLTLRRKHTTGPKGEPQK